MIELQVIGLTGLVCLLLLLAARMPVWLALVMVGVGGTYALGLTAPYLRFEPYLAQFKTLLWGTVASYELSVLPLFVLMGCLAARAHLSRDLFRGLMAVIGPIRGGVIMAAVAACAGFGAVCGSSLATASTMGRVALPELHRLNHAPRLATGALAAGGTLGILIPPSVVLVIYAVIVQGSIMAMFQAAIVPGLLAVLLFVGVIAVTVRLDPAAAPETERMPPAERRRAILRLLPVLALFGGIILGLGLGLFTPTPAAAVGAFAVFAYGWLLRVWGDGLTWAGTRLAMLDAAVTTGMIYAILFGAEVFKGFIARAGLPQALADWASASALDPVLVLAAMLVLLLVLGCFMDSLSMILVFVPFFWPALVALNGGAYVSAEMAAFGLTTEQLKIWFGILALVVVELGLITPPLGLNVFIISGLSRDVPMRETFLGVLPFVGVELLRVALIFTFPVLTLGRG